MQKRRRRGKARGAIAFALIFSLVLSFASRQKKESKRLEKRKHSSNLHPDKKENNSDKENSSRDIEISILHILNPNPLIFFFALMQKRNKKIKKEMIYNPFLSMRFDLAFVLL